jgi:hypothetical protein
VLRPREPNNCLTSPWQIARFQEIPEVWGGEEKMPIYSCPRCGGKESYKKRIHELRADGFSRAPTGPKAQKFKNVDLVINACKSCGEEMEEEFTLAEIEENNQATVEEILEGAKVGKRIYRIVGFTLTAISALVFVILGIDVTFIDDSPDLLPLIFWTLAFGIPGIHLVRKYSKVVVSVWIVSPGTNSGDYRSVLSEYAKNDKQLSSMLSYIETNTPFNASGAIGLEEAREFSERLKRLGANVMIG